jgi:hypothetical protein
MSETDYNSNHAMKQAKTDILQGTLDLLILRTLAAGDMHGWGISQRLLTSRPDRMSFLGTWALVLGPSLVRGPRCPVSN